MNEDRERHLQSVALPATVDDRLGTQRSGPGAVSRESPIAEIIARPTARLSSTEI